MYRPIRSRPPSGDGLTSGVLSADRCEIRIDCWSPARRKSGLLCATAFNHEFVASRRSRVDAFVTPSGLATLASGHLPAKPGEPSDPRADPPAERNPFAGARTTRDGLDRFSIWVPDDEGREIRFVLSLSGFRWRLSNVVLPLPAS